MSTLRSNRPTWLVWPALFLAVVAADQLSKALVPRPWCIFDPGTGTLWPWTVSRAFENPYGGAALDVAAAGMLTALVGLALRHVRRPLTRAGCAVLLAGLSSNLLDRVGLAHLTQGARGQQVVNWFNIGLWRVNVGNVADCCYVAGPALLLASASFLCARWLQARMASPAAVLGIVPSPATEGAAGAARPSGGAERTEASEPLRQSA